MTATLAHQSGRHGIWTDDYCLRHCEGYSVRGPEGMVGFVEEVWLSPQDDKVESLLVRRTDRYETLAVPLELVERVDTGAECVVLAAPEP